MDIAARRIGMDPLELRRRNLLRSADLPYTTPSGQVFDDVTPLETLEEAAAILDYEEFRALQARERRRAVIWVSAFRSTSSLRPCLLVSGPPTRARFVSIPPARCKS